MYSYMTMLLVGLLARMAWQDFRDRAIDWYLFPMALLLLAGSGRAIHIPWSYALINLGLLGAQLTLLTLYVYLTRGHGLMKGQRMLGWGDVLFFGLLTLGFSPLNFLMFYLMSLLLALLGFLLWRRFGGKPGTVPLAGMQAICLMGILLIDLPYMGEHLYRDDLFLTMF